MKQATQFFYSCLSNLNLTKTSNTYWFAKNKYLTSTQSPAVVYDCCIAALSNHLGDNGREQSYPGPFLVAPSQTCSNVQLTTSPIDTTALDFRIVSLDPEDPCTMFCFLQCKDSAFLCLQQCHP